jgi:hypothetical protein
MNNRSTMDKNLTQGCNTHRMVEINFIDISGRPVCDVRNESRACRHPSRTLAKNRRRSEIVLEIPPSSSPPPSSSLLTEAREFTFRRISAGETDSSAGHVRPARRPRKGNGRSRNFNDHPSRSTANFSCARNSSIPQARLTASLGRGETGVDLPAIECRLD